jgi:hypothetical protein
MVLNFVAFLGLAAVLIAVARLRSQLRVVIDVLLAGLSLATLYAWNAMGRANPAGMGTMALLVEFALIVLALGDALFIAVSSVMLRRLRRRSA